MNWISVKDRPLYTEDNGRIIATKDAENSFMAAIQEMSGDYWVHHCIFEDETGLCVVDEDFMHNQPASYEIEDIDYFIPVSPPQNQNAKQITLESMFDELSDEDRNELLSKYCQCCGDKDSSCQCWNDE